MTIRTSQRRRAAAALAVSLVASLSGSAVAPAISLAVDPAVDCPWVGSSAPPEVRAGQVLAQMTQDEKFQVITATRPVVGIPRLCIPGVYQQGGPGGPNAGRVGVTQLPMPLALAATFDRGLAREYGGVIGEETRATGTSLVGGPTLDTARNVLSGRNYETYGEDPFLSGYLAAETVKGIQDHQVMAMTKHYSVYNQQTDRTTSNLTVDERTIREIYLPGFESAVKNGGSLAIMCSYSSINGDPACANEHLLNDVLKGDWGFPGIVANDWFAQTQRGLSIDQFVNGGLDYELPSPDRFRTPLQNAVAAGLVSQDRIDDMAFRALYAMFAAGLIDNPVPLEPSLSSSTPENRAVGEEVADRSAVLLKNRGQLLPLDGNDRNIVVIGPSASTYPITTGGPSAGVMAGTPFVTALQGIAARAGSGAHVTYYEGVEPVTPHNAMLPGLPNVPQSTLTALTGEQGLTGRYYSGTSTTPVATRIDKSVNFDWSEGRASTLYPIDNRPPGGTTRQEFQGTFTAPGAGEYTFELYANGDAQVVFDGQVAAAVTSSATNSRWSVSLAAGSTHSVFVSAAVSRTNGHLKLGWQPPAGVVAPAIAEAAAAARAADVAVVYATDWSTEFEDKVSFELAGNQDALIDAVTKANPHTIVVMNTSGPVAMPWVDQAGALLQVWYPGQAGGSAIASVLWGDVDPSGRLPVSFPRRLEDSATGSDPNRFPGVDLEVSYSEGLDVGYRWFDSQGIEPLYPFGYGLSYAKFALSQLRVTETGPAAFDASLDVKNTSNNRSGHTVIQAYVAMPASTGEPPRQLRAIANVDLDPKQKVRVTLSLDPRDFAFWDTASGDWQVAAGTYAIYVGTSSALDDLTLVKEVSIRQTLHVPASGPLEQ